jgi:spore maturation protein A
MLNYIWISLIIIGVAVAITVDIHDQSSNKYRNGEEFRVDLRLQKPFVKELNTPVETTVFASRAQFEQFYGPGTAGADTIRQSASVTLSPGGRGAIILNLDDHTPSIWKEMGEAATTKGKLSGKILSFTLGNDDRTMSAVIVFEPITFVRIKRVTQAALDYAATAVNISLGLIGIMALWLGIMRVADEAGAIKFLARILRPFMKFLFPDVPSDHPAVGSMIMNISANMLGLSNAATPLGLKAMEELDKLNPRKGVATNAMCTFLAINTAGLTLIPATAIAVRVAAGSSNPTVIVGTTIVGGICSTVVGVLAAKLLQRLPVFRKQIELNDLVEKTEREGRR